MLKPPGFNIANATKEGICGHHTSIRGGSVYPQMLDKLQGALLVNGSELSLQGPSWVGNVLFANIQLGPSLEMGQLVEENGFVDRPFTSTVPLTVSDFLFKHFCSTFSTLDHVLGKGDHRDGQDSPLSSSCSVGETKQVTITLQCDKGHCRERSGGCRILEEGPPTQPKGQGWLPAGAYVLTES